MSLASRLDRVLSQGSPESVESFRTLTVVEMGETKITFGRAHVGRTYEEMWRSEKGWIRWFAKTYASSQKEEHQKLLIYIETMVNQHETLYDMNPVTAPETNQEVIRPRPKGQPKSKGSSQSCPGDANDQRERRGRGAMGSMGCHVPRCPDSRNDQPTARR